MKKIFTKWVAASLFLGGMVLGGKVGAQINMTAGGSTTTCSGTFYDSGGPNGLYGANENLVHTIYPQPNNLLRVSFTSFNVYDFFGDTLKIYNGNSTSAPLIGAYESNPGNIQSTAPDGSLTFSFRSGGFFPGPGWAANLSCVSNLPCAGQPAPGNATPSVATVCSGVAFTINVQNTSMGGGMAYQWQSSPDGFVWTDIPGQIYATFTGTQTQALSYRLRATCLAGPSTGYSGVATVALTSPMNCYCTSVATGSDDEDITNVTFAGINNTTPANCDTYHDYSNIMGSMVKGVPYNITVNTGDCEGAGFYQRRVSVFIDWNQNGQFTDPGEQVFNPAVAQGALSVLFTGSVTAPATALTGTTKMRVICREGSANIVPCGDYGYGETEDYSLEVLGPIADEAGILAITEPATPACSLGQIEVMIQNLGTNALTSAVFTLKVNNVNVPVAAWSGNIPPQGTANVPLQSSYVLNDNDSVWVGISMPNGQTENPLMAFNNSVGRRIIKGLSGIKTVGGATPDFVDMNAVITALQQRGVCDTVVFRIAPGGYTTQHVFPEYPGAGAGRMVIFESASGNADDVSFTFGGTSAFNNYVFRFNGNGYMLRKLTVRNTGATFSRVVDITPVADNLILENNIFVGDTSGPYNASVVNASVIYGLLGGVEVSKIVVKGNRIFGGSRGVFVNGSTNYSAGFTLEENTVEKYGFAGAELNYLSGATVTKNKFRPKANFTQAVAGISVSDAINGGVIDGNDIISSRPGNGISLKNVKGASEGVKVTNNFIYQGDTVGAARGIWVQDANTIGVLVANNSISLHTNNTAVAAFVVSDGTQIRFLNNNIGSFRNAPCMLIEKPYSISESDNNNFFGVSVAQITGNPYATVSALQAGTGRNTHSVGVNPGFNGTDLHTCAPQLNAAGIFLPSVISDFDGDTRSGTPDIGADEFFGDGNGLLSQDEFLKCPSVQVTLGNPPTDGVTYAWTPSGNTAQITTAAAGTYVVTGTSSCGVFKDTAVVANKPLPVASFTSTSVGLTGIFNNTSGNGVTYLWDFGDGTTSTEINPSHVYAAAGTYSVKLAVGNECDTVIFGPQPVNVINAGIDETGSPVRISLFPNPTDGQFVLAMGAELSEPVTVSVTDVTGKTVLLKNIPAGVQQIALDATSFSSGIYSVKINGMGWNRVVRLVRE